MKNHIMPIVRTEISKDIENNLGKKIIFLYGHTGSGKSYLAEAVANNNINKKYQDKIIIKCCKDSESKYNDDQIYNYKSFLSYLIRKTEVSKYISPDSNEEEKVEALKNRLIKKEGKKNFIIVKCQHFFRLFF